MTSTNISRIETLTARTGIMLFVLKMTLAVFRRPTVPLSLAGILIFSVPALIAAFIMSGRRRSNSSLGISVVCGLAWMYFAGFTLEIYLVDVSQVIHHGGVIVLWPWLAFSFGLALLLLVTLGIRLVLISIRKNAMNRNNRAQAM